MLNYYNLLIKRQLIIILTLVAIISCSMQKNKQVSQGIEGHIIRVSGNQMPMKGRPAAKGKGIIAEVFIYTATTVQQAQGQMPLFNQINGKAVVHTKSDSTGNYKVALPAGKYSVFIKTNGQFFAAETDGQGILNPAEVTTGQVTRRDITFNIGVAY